MAESAEGQPRAIEPEHLGAIGDPSRQTGEADFFPGEDKFLGKSSRAQKKRLWSAVGPTAERFMADEEHVLYVAHGYQSLSLLRALGLGILGPRYHQVALVLTDRQLIEILLDGTGKRPESRVRTIPWNATSDASASMGNLVVKPQHGKKLKWRVRQAGDRKILKRMLPMIRNKMEGVAPDGSAEVPRIHCHGCANVLPKDEESCPQCGGMVRSRGLAALLSIGFPGAGLYYLGHPVLGTLDLMGELIFFVLVGLGLAVSEDPATQWGTVATAALFLFLTKVESLHVGEILAARRRTETPQRRETWRRRLWMGSSLSVVAVATALALAGSFVTKIDRDVEFAEEGGDWAGTRDPSQVLQYADDPSVRSQWTRSEGWIVTVFAYPLGLVETSASVYADIATMEGFVPGSRRHLAGGRSGTFDGFTVEQDLPDATGEVFRHINYFVVDPSGDDLHHMLLVASPELAEEARAVIEDLISTGDWIDAAR